MSWRVENLWPCRCSSKQRCSRRIVTIVCKTGKREITCNMFSLRHITVGIFAEMRRGDQRVMTFSISGWQMGTHSSKSHYPENAFKVFSVTNRNRITFETPSTIVTDSGRNFQRGASNVHPTETCKYLHRCCCCCRWLTQQNKHQRWNNILLVGSIAGLHCTVVSFDMHPLHPVKPHELSRAQYPCCGTLLSGTNSPHILDWAGQAVRAFCHLDMQGVVGSNFLFELYRCGTASFSVFKKDVP